MKKAERARLLCRDLRHPWDVTAVWLVEDDLVERHLSCPRCGTERVDKVVRSSGEIDSRRYVYAEGYAQPAGEGRMASAEARALLMRTVRVRDIRQSA